MVEQAVQVRIRGGPQLKKEFREWLRVFESEIGRVPSQEEAMLELLKRARLTPSAQKDNSARVI